MPYKSTLLGAALRGSCFDVGGCGRVTFSSPPHRLPLFAMPPEKYLEPTLSKLRALGAH